MAVIILYELSNVFMVGPVSFETNLQIQTQARTISTAI